jgi:hypothetical protein
MPNSLFNTKLKPSKQTICGPGLLLPKHIIHTKVKATVAAIAMGIFTSLITACASTDSLPDIELPSNAAAFNRAALKGDMLRAADLYIERKFGCDEWTLNGVTESAAFGQLVFTREGQLYRGEISEIWNVMQCGTDLALRFRAEPAPDGSSLIRIRAAGN